MDQDGGGCIEDSINYMYNSLQIAPRVHIEIRDATTPPMMQRTNTMFYAHFQHPPRLFRSSN